MQAAHAALLHVVQFLLHPPQGSGEGIGVHHHAHHIVSLVPVRVVLPPLVQPFELLIPLPAALFHGCHQLLKHADPALVQLAVEPFQLVVVSFQPAAKNRLSLHFHHLVCMG